MSLLKVSDNYSASIVGNFSTTAETITVDVAPVKTAGYLTVFDLNGNQFEKIKYAGVSGLNLTGCVRGLSFDDNSDTPVVGNAKELKNGMAIKMTVSQNYLNPVIDFVNQYNGKWMDAVADFATLPQPAEDGEVRVTLDDSKLYVYDLDTTTWNLAGAGGGAGTVYITTLLGTESTGDDNMTFTMTSGSYSSLKYLQVYKNGVLMTEGASNDYQAPATDSNWVAFNEPVEDDDVITLLVVSVDLYNPAWNNVNDDILPGATESYSIGSALKKFTTGFFSGIVSALSFTGDGSNLDDGANGKLTSGVTNGKLVRMTTGDKLPSVDGSNLTNLVASKKIYFDYTTRTNTNSNAENTYLTATIPGGSLSTSNYIKGKVFFSNINSNGSSAGGTIKLKFGSSTLATLTFPSAPLSSTYNEVNFIISATGAFNSQNGYLSGYFGFSSPVWLSNADSATEDSTSNKTLSITMQINDAAADGASSFGYIELIK